ncbi:MAG TPA: DUF2278 family protein [Pseudonocardiaceae bacterium]
MALDEYGVLVGRLTTWARDTPDAQGRWYHVTLTVAAPAADGTERRFRCAVDVDSHASATGVQWKVLRPQASAIGAPAGLAPGYHALPSNRAAGALDHLRHPAIRERFAWLRLLPAWFRRPWTTGSHEQATLALEAVLVRDAVVRVFGEPFTSGFGMHNIHQNQGDPAGSQWWDENAIWQDGAVLVDRRDGTVDVFVSKFTSQAHRTDADGHPA